MVDNQLPRYWLYKVFWNSLDWLYPPYCAGCNTFGQRWCSNCDNLTVKLEKTICEKCGRPMSSSGTCLKCSQSEPRYEALRSWGIFQGPLREAIHSLKYKKNIGVGESLSKPLIQMLDTLKWQVEMIVPVPLSEHRMNERGYNQAGYLARPVALARNIAYNPNSIQRVKDTISQIGLSLSERKDNIRDAFSANAKKVKGKTVLVIDDVTTTGATIEACSEALMEAGATKVYGLTLARTVLQSER